MNQKFIGGGRIILLAAGGWGGGFPTPSLGKFTCSYFTMWI